MDGHERMASDPSTDRALILAGRHALVTGGSRGIGAACGRALATLGATVTLLARDRDRLTETSRRIGAETGRTVGYIAADVADRAALVAALDSAAAARGPIDVLVNNAGGAVGAPLQAVTDDDWAAALAVNLSSAFWATRAVVPAMQASGFGRVVNVASTAALKGYAYVAAYCAAKHGLVGLTRALAVELAATGITVNAVCPGFAETEMTEDAIARIAAATGRSADEARAALVAFNPQGRLVRPREVADAVAFLCLPSSAGITGVALPVAGGEIA